MDLVLIYKIVALISAGMALVWSFVLDKNKPPTATEFIAKLVVRALFILLLLSVVVGVVTMALGGPSDQ